MMKLSAKKNENIQELLGRISTQLEETRKAAHKIMDDESITTLTANSKIIATGDRMAFENYYYGLLHIFLQLQSEMSEEEPQ